ncbi:hypothetical protein NDU88_007269 [Pleurodeles waltl]|uniref:Uncharacterized protein n=1 Tax=Pleurodeles waltl TaxID=8319 RepID=A0AAV7LRK2_PLEWA|nr:hypothetical protein NDU88_007269 [Pleurodeles waltl]
MQGAGPNIPVGAGRNRGVEVGTRERRGRQTTERNKTEEETQEDETRETGPGNGRQGEPTRISTLED